MTRAELLLAGVSNTASILEIGPCYDPIAPKADGWNTKILDAATRPELVSRLTGFAGINLDAIEEIDFVWRDGPLIDAIPRHHHGTFDVLIASHVIEHMPDVIGFLDAAAILLSQDGRFVLAIPDKRLCFDYFRALATTGDLLDAMGRTRHARRAVFNGCAYSILADGKIAWSLLEAENLSFMRSLKEAYAHFLAHQEDGAYNDLHGWHFTPASFRLLILELAALGVLDWRIERLDPAGHEFHARLARGGIAEAERFPIEHLDIRRLDLMCEIMAEAAAQLAALRRATSG